MHKSLVMLLLLGFALFLGRTCDAKSQPLKIVKELDLARYAGTWHEIARLPNYFERKCTSNVTANYTLRKDGTVDVLNQCETGGEGERAQGVGKPLDPSSKAGHLKVTFAPAFLRALPFVWADYCVIELDNSYQYALVGEPSRRYLWVLARDKNMSQEQYDALIAVAKAQGFDTTKMIRNK
jgi:apolipoprotein D and lipocalin family protein